MFAGKNKKLKILHISNFGNWLFNRLYFISIAKKLSNIVSKVIITLGPKGVVMCEKDKIPIHIKGHSVNVRTAHGAGDYFAGKFLLNYIKNNNFENSIRVANKKTAEFIST